jgi:hypothetical protein
MRRGTYRARARDSTEDKPHPVKRLGAAVRGWGVRGEEEERQGGGVGEFCWRFVGGGGGGVFGGKGGGVCGGVVCLWGARGGGDCWVARRVWNIVWRVSGQLYGNNTRYIWETTRETSSVFAWSRGSEIGWRLGRGCGVGYRVVARALVNSGCSCSADAWGGRGEGRG